MTPTPQAARGFVLPLIVAVLLVVGIIALGVYGLQRHSFKALHFHDGRHLAILTGDACQVRILTRLEKSPWSERWFKNGQDSDEGEWEGGSYEYVIADGPGGKDADLVVWASHGDARISMYWRLRPAPLGLYAHRKVLATYFMFPDGDVGRSQAALDPFRAQVDRDLVRRNDNAPWLEWNRDRLIHARTPAEVFDILRPNDPRLPGQTPDRTGPTVETEPVSIPTFPTQPAAPAPLPPAAFPLRDIVNFTGTGTYAWVAARDGRVVIKPRLGPGGGGADMKVCLYGVDGREIRFANTSILEWHRPDSVGRSPLTWLGHEDPGSMVLRAANDWSAANDLSYETSIAKGQRLTLEVTGDAPASTTWTSAQSDAIDP